MADKLLSEDEIERYARHLVLPEVGGKGQQKLKAARVLVIGAGGLGSPVLHYLAAAGVGTLRVVDNDVVSLSNLQRQIIHDTNAVGTTKVESAAQSIARINPHCRIEAVAARFDEANQAALLTGCTLAIDGSDNFATRYRVAEACETAKVPLVTGAVNRFDGSVTVLMPWELEPNDSPVRRANPRYRDLFPSQPDDGALPSCAEAGVLGATTGIIGTIQAAEAIKLITGAGDPLVGRLLMVDTLRMSFNSIRYRRPV